MVLLNRLQNPFKVMHMCLCACAYLGAALYASTSVCSATDDDTQPVRAVAEATMPAPQTTQPTQLSRAPARGSIAKNIFHPIRSVAPILSHAQNEFDGLRQDVAGLTGAVQKLNSPINELGNPIGGLRQPLSGVDRSLDRLHDPLDPTERAYWKS